MGGGGGGGPVQSESVGGHRSGNNFLVVSLHFFGSKSTISRFGERFRDGQYSFVSFLVAVLLLTVPPVPKSGGHPPLPHGVGATVPLLLFFYIPTINRQN